MRIPKAAHTAQPWRIHEFTRDFRIEDVWSFRAPGAGPDDFAVMLAVLKAAYDTRKEPPATRFLFAVRWKLGALLGWDTPQAGLGRRVASLRDRLPSDLAQTANDATPCTDPFTEVYQLDNEAARELANKTVHDIMHLGWVPTNDGGYELRMAALVKPNGLFGRLYMVFIAPFRYLIIYPALTRQWEGAWQDRTRLLAKADPADCPSPRSVESPYRRSRDARICREPLTPDSTARSAGLACHAVTRSQLAGQRAGSPSAPAAGPRHGLITTTPC